MAWAIAAVALIVLEVLTVNLIFIMLAGGAIAASVLALLSVGASAQFGVFAVMSLLLVGFVRPVALRHLRIPASLRTGVDALSGQEAVVVEAVNARDGRVKIGGEVWSARSYDPSVEHDVGEVLHVIEISGATALVG